MLQNSLLLIISLLFVVSMLTMLSEKVKISYPILLVIAGLGIGFIPGIPSITLAPDLVFIIFLPPYCILPPGILPGMISGVSGAPLVSWHLDW